ncbi:MAG: DNA recombination/repair protein RecA [Proteobacteria bacterium]|nr:DNA recombination/repair protein RecA [Pseudomonadota bacterium]
MDKDRAKKLDTVFSQIEKQFGEGSLMKLGSDHVRKMPSISTGALSIDLALGIGGVPKGRVIEIYGPESSGKTTLSLHIAAEAQKAGGVAAFIDAEHALDPIYASALGVDVDELLVSQPDTGEQALEIANMLIDSGGVDVVVIDSVAALVPQAEIDGEMGQSHVGLQARLMSQALRKLTSSINKTQTTVKEAEFDIMFGQGISREGSLLDVGVDHGIVRKAGAWFTYEEIQLGQGKENSKRFLRENADIALQLESDVYKAVGMIESDEATEEETVEESKNATPEK